MTKSELRKLHLRRQRAFSAEERAAKSASITDNFFSNFDLSSVRCLHCFIAIEKFREVDTTLIFRRLWHEFPLIVTAVPRVKPGTAAMDNLKFTPDTDLVKNVWDIHEPFHDEYVATADIDMVLVPGLAFDRTGHRAGFGKGFYDKFLAACRPDCLKIGLSYFEPVDAIADTHNRDIALNALITPEKIHHF